MQLPRRLLQDAARLLRAAADLRNVHPIDSVELDYKKDGFPSKSFVNHPDSVYSRVRPAM